MKGPDMQKREITQDAYDFAKGESGGPSSSAVAAKLVNTKARLQSSFAEANGHQPHDSHRGAADAINSLADTFDEINSESDEQEPMPEFEPEPENASGDESNPLKQMFPGIKSMTIQFHETSNPLREMLSESKTVSRPVGIGSNPLREMLLEANVTIPPVNERAVKVGNSTYWRTGDKYYTKGPDGKRREISSSEYDSAIAKKRDILTQKTKDAYKDVERTVSTPQHDDAFNNLDAASKARQGYRDRDDIEHRDRQARLGFSRNGWVSKESMDLAETPASQIQGKKDVKTIKTEPGQKVTPESLKGLMGIGKPAAFKAIADALNNGEEIGQAEVDGDRILYYGDHVIVK